MGTRILAWWHFQRRTRAVPGILSGLAIALIVVAFAFLGSPGSSPPTPRRTALLPKSQERLSARVAEFAPGVKVFAQELLLRTRTVEEDASEEAIEAYSNWVTAWSERFTQDLERAVTEISQEERELPGEVRRFLQERLREVTGPCVVELSFHPAGAGRSFFASPRARAVPTTVEMALEKVIQRLVALLPKVPPKGREGVKEAIAAIRRTGISFDEHPPVIAINSPTEGQVLQDMTVLSVSATVADSLSGLDPSKTTVTLDGSPVTNQL